MLLDTGAKVDEPGAGIFVPQGRGISGASVRVLLNCRIFRLVIADVSLSVNAVDDDERHRT